MLGTLGRATVLSLPDNAVFDDKTATVFEHALPVGLSETITKSVH